jgi:hypothetical protein
MSFTSKSPELTATELERVNLTDSDTVITRDIIQDSDVLAHLDLRYSTDDHTVSIETVAILDTVNRNKGIGKKVYEMVSSLPTPDGEHYTFVSRMQSDDARRVWESFVRNRQAIKRDDGSYEMLQSEEK